MPATGAAFWRKRQHWFNQSGFNVFLVFLLRLYCAITEGLAGQGVRPACKALRMTLLLLGSPCFSAERTLLMYVAWAQHWSCQSLQYRRTPQRDSVRRFSPQRQVSCLASCPVTRHVRPRVLGGKAGWCQAVVVAWGNGRIASPAWRSCCWERSPGGAPPRLGLFQDKESPKQFLAFQRQRVTKTVFSVAPQTQVLLSGMLWCH